MKKPILVAIFFVSALALVSFIDPGTATKNNPESSVKVYTGAGKAWWISEYINHKDKKILISYVYNNDCNHCDNEILEDFDKWLKLNDYYNYKISRNILNIHRDSKEDADEKREKDVLYYKEQGYTVTSINYSYTKK